MSGGGSEEPNQSREIRLLVAYHSDTSPAPALRNLSVSLRELPISKGSNWLEGYEAEVDLFVLLVDARTGISTEMIDIWQHHLERQFPRVLLVQGIELSESDFDDIVMIANRVLEQIATPYLVLHDDLGQPIGLISLEDNVIHDYTGENLNRYSADPELVELVSEFQEEYLQLYQNMGERGFAEGTFALAIPIGLHKPIGISEFEGILKALSKQ